MAQLSHTVVSIVFDGLAYAMILFIVSVGLSVTMGLMGFVNLAHGVFAMVGGYVAVSCMSGLGLGFLPALLVSSVCVGVASLALERVFYAPLYRAGELDQVLMSIGLVFMATAVVTRIYGPSPVNLQVPELLSGQIVLGGRAFPAYRAFMIVVGLGLAAVLWLVFERTILGAKVRAAVENRRMAESIGIDVDWLFRIVFALGSGVAALGGGLAVDVWGLSPTFAIQYLVLFLVVVAVGGLGTIRGPFVAALVLGMIDNGGKYLWPEGGAFFIYLVTIAILLARPQGLYGRG